MKKELIVDTSSIITVSVGVGNIIRTCISQKDVSICRIIVISYILYMSILLRVVLQDLGVILVKMCVIIVLLQLYSATCRISFSYNSPFFLLDHGKRDCANSTKGTDITVVRTTAKHYKCYKNEDGRQVHLAWKCMGGRSQPLQAWGLLRINPPIL